MLVAMVAGNSQSTISLRIARANIHAVSQQQAYDIGVTHRR